MRSNTTLAALLAIALDIPFGGPHVARADDLKPEVLLLAHFKQRVRQDIARLNNCVCLQTIERSMQPAGGNSSQFVDRIRLEITRVGGTELLAWPGGERFEERDVKSFVRGGLVFGGMFASQVRNVFLGEQSTFHYVGPENLQGHHAARFDFSIPPLAGSYKIGSGDKSAWVGSKGSFWFDTESLDMLRLEESAEQIPAELGITSVSTRIQFGEMRTTEDLLVPQSAEVQLTHSSGEIRRDTIQFTHCRVYTADSSIKFEAPSPEQGQAREELPSVVLPPGLTIRMELEDSLDESTAAVGDPLRGRVTNDVRLKGVLLLPKGATGAGRLRGMERRAKAGGFLVSIEIKELRWGKNRAELHAQLVEAQGTPQKPKRGKEGDAGNLIGLADGSLSTGVPTVVELGKSKSGGARIPGICMLWLKDEPWHLAEGLKMVWRTLAP